MKRIKRCVLAVITALICCISASAAVYAEEISVADELDIDVGSISEELPYDVSEILDEKGISADNTESITSVTPSDVFGYMIEQFKAKAAYPLKIFITLMCIIILNALAEGMNCGVSNKQLEKIYGMVCVLVSVGIISGPVTDCIDSVSEALYSGGNFMISYIPVFAGITASSGCITSAAAYSTILLAAAEAAVQIASNYVMPILSLCMALGVIEAVNPSFNLTHITFSVTKVINFVLGFIMTIFIGLLSIQNIIGTSADTLGVKAAKFLASNCIPVVGGAVADAYTTIKSSLGILRGGVGFIGIAAIFLTVVPPLAEIMLMKLAFGAAEMFGEIFELKGIKILMKNASSVLSVLLSLTVCFSMMLIISTAIMLMTGLDVS